MDSHPCSAREDATILLCAITPNPAVNASTKTHPPTSPPSIPSIRVGCHNRPLE